jgi:hypothetical protein
MSQHQTEGSAAGHFLTRSAFTPPTRLPSSCSYAALWILFKPETFEWHAVATLATWASGRRSPDWLKFRTRQHQR